jgi:peptidoglycan hydrolase CwlO-like protein
VAKWSDWFQPQSKSAAPTASSGPSNADFKALKDRVTALETKQVTMQADITKLKSDVTVLKGDMATAKADIVLLKQGSTTDPGVRVIE